MKKPIIVISDMGTRHNVYHYFYSDARANLFMTINLDYGVLCVKGKQIYVALLSDKGVTV